MTTTAGALIATWAARDHRYATRKIEHHPHPLSDAERRIVRDLRLREIEALPARERAKAWAAWQRGLAG